MTNTTNEEFSLQSLQAEFAAFRSQSRLRTRVPDHLRRGVLKALDSGVTVSHLRSALGVTKTQLVDWQGRKKKSDSKKVSFPAIQPRVLDVVSAPETKGPSGLRISYESNRLVLELSF